MPPNPVKRVLLPLVVLVAGVAVAFFFLRTAPQTEPEQKKRAPKIVQVIDVHPAAHPIHVTAQGTVIPARQLTVQPQVSGRVTAQHPDLVPGGRIAAGESIVTIDPADYQLILEEQQAALEESKYEFALEQGRQVVAAREWQLLEKDLPADAVNQDLVLRKPHLDRAQAAIAKANNAIDKAKLDLERTNVTAPFDAIVLSEDAELGQLLSNGDTIATIAGTAEFWVQITLPVSDLQYLSFPSGDKPGARATITLDTGENQADAETTTNLSWDGTLLRLLGDLESFGRMARVLARVENPLAETQSAPLLLGSYVRVDIDAGTLDNVIAVPRTALHDGRLWAVGGDNLLKIRDTELRWVDGDTLLVDNTLAPGEKLIVSNLRAALPDMEVAPQPAP